ncbi:terminase [bacterium]|nr:MAG: terminase [bacterium]
MAQEIKPENRAFQPRPGALEILYAKEPEVVVSGPAGTGKSRAGLEKLFLSLGKYAGARALLCRKTRVSLTQSGLVTWEDKVVPASSPILDGPARANRKSYLFPNGSELVIGGLDKPGRIMSTEFDLIYVQEAIELDEDDWESLSTRLRNGVMPYQQLMGDTNPDRPTHWLKKRCDENRSRIIHSRHEDNPLFWSLKTNDWTPVGRAYIDKLDALTGARKERLRYGRWVGSEGTIFEYDPRIHSIPRRELPRDWDRIWVFDFGYTNPFVWQQWVIDPDGRMILDKQIYLTNVLVEDHCKAILEATEDDPSPTRLICDHDAEDRATVEKHLGMLTEPATKAVSRGIQLTKSRFQVAGDGKPRIMFMEGSLIHEPDEDLIEAKKPTSTEKEFDGYIWDPKQKKGEQPLKKDDHGADGTRYGVMAVDEPRQPTSPTTSPASRIAVIGRR